MAVSNQTVLAHARLLADGDRPGPAWVWRPLSYDAAHMLDQRIQQQFFESADLLYACAQGLAFA